MPAQQDQQQSPYLSKQLLRSDTRRARHQRAGDGETAAEQILTALRQCLAGHRQEAGKMRLVIRTIEAEAQLQRMQLLDAEDRPLQRSRALRSVNATLVVHQDKAASYNLPMQL